MRKAWNAVLLVVCVTGMLAPSTTAEGEPVTREYRARGVSVEGVSLPSVPCIAVCFVTAGIRIPDGTASVRVTVNDVASGANAPVQVCLFRAGAFPCSQVDCGETVALETEGATSLSVAVYLIRVATSQPEACLGTAGTYTVTFVGA